MIHAVAPALLQGALAVDEFVNADVIAGGLSAFEPDRVAIAAGRIMLDQPLTTTWALYNTSGPRPALVAEGLASETIGVYDKDVWEAIKRQGTV